ncbi:MAG: tol-pal system-associated acyl-CoA thioesterase [Xanthomonadales bacterium]|nr:tol-pal system-associated acyl-CoA thioesterase [Xanthomonadales bacterium]
MSREVFEWPVRVYWEDTDAGGVVYYANYLRFLERARTEWVRSLGVDQSRLQAEQQVVLVVRSLQCDFLAPARLDDELGISVVPEAIGAATLEMRQEVVRRETGEVLLAARVKAACLDSERWRPRRFPPVLRAALATENA